MTETGKSRFFGNLIIPKYLNILLLFMPFQLWDNPINDLLYNLKNTELNSFLVGLKPVSGPSVPEHV